MTMEEKVDRLMEMQYIAIQQLNSIIDYISSTMDVPVESHEDIMMEGDVVEPNTVSK